MLILSLLSAIGVIIVALNILVWIIPALIFLVIYIIFVFLDRNKTSEKKASYSSTLEGVFAFSFLIMAVIIMLVCVIKMI